MTSFANALKSEASRSITENGMACLNTTGNCVLDLFGTIGSLRGADKLRVERLFADAYQEDKLLATKCLFYGRDVRGGLGERYTFRTLLKYAANRHPEAIRPNIKYIGVYGRYDDLYELIGTQLESDMWTFMKQQLVADLNAMGENKPVSLLAKWIKTPDASSPKTRKLGIMTALKLGIKVKMFKRLLRGLRRYIDVIETHMSNDTWEAIDYEKVSSRAMFLHKNAFIKHDGERFYNYLANVSKGEAKIHSGTLYPYDIVEKLIGNDDYFRHVEEDPVLEEQWKNLPNYLDGDASAIVIADTSGSMSGRPMASAVALAVYFAERNKGPFKNLWMTFSEDSRVNMLKGETLAQKLSNINTEGWGWNTNLERAFEQVLDIAVKNHVPAEEMVKSLIIISDMEIDEAVDGKNPNHWLFYDQMRDKFEAAGYTLPNIVFWQVDARHDTFHADKDRKGVQLCSGQSAATFQHLMHCVTMTPLQMMLEVLNSDRYSDITVE